MLRISGVTSGLPTDGFGDPASTVTIVTQVREPEMRAERDFNNRCEFDLAMSEIHELPPHWRRSHPGTRSCAGPERVHSAAKGISSKPPAGPDPLALRSISMRARSATGTCRWPG